MQPELTLPDSPPSDRSGRRLLIVGDVHGCGGELQDLLEAISPGAQDRVIFVGDVVDRGPSVARVFDLLREVRGELVLGNHEDRLLRWRLGESGGHHMTVRLAPHHQATVAQLRPSDWETMVAARPYIEVPEHDLVVLHGGMRPGMALAEQDREDICRLQSIGRTGRRRKWGTPGSRFWAETCDYPGWVIYGHTHFRQPMRYLKTLGIDTGCCFGGQLTALELPSWRLYRVQAARNYMLEMMRLYYPTWANSGRE